jgi:hypothetical protein
MWKKRKKEKALKESKTLDEIKKWPSIGSVRGTL